jgi:hypothetical protein
MAGASGFRDLDDPQLAAREPTPWALRHQYEVQESDGCLWRVSHWDSAKQAQLTSVSRFEDLAPYFQCRVHSAEILSTFASPFDQRDTLRVEQSRMQSAMADRLYVAYQFASGAIANRSALSYESQRQAALDAAAGVQLSLRYDLLGMFAVPRSFSVPTLEPLEANGLPSRADGPLSVLNMAYVFGQFKKAVDAPAADGPRVAFAQHAGANFLSVDAGRSWLRMTLDEPSGREADAIDFLRRVVATAAQFDAAVAECVEAGWMHRHGEAFDEAEPGEVLQLRA